MTSITKDAVGYLLASGCALALDLGVLTVLVRYLGWYLAAAIVSFTIGSLATYVLSITLIFRHRSVHERRLEFLSFTMIGVIGLGINAAIIFLAVSYIGLYYLTAKVLAAVFTFGFNFFARRRLFQSRVTA
jgi:putative flippase GtrA